MCFPVELERIGAAECSDCYHLPVSRAICYSSRAVIRPKGATRLVRACFHTFAFKELRTPDEITKTLYARRVVFATLSPEWKATNVDAMFRAFGGQLATPIFLTAKDLLSRVV